MKKHKLIKFSWILPLTIGIIVSILYLMTKSTVFVIIGFILLLLILLISIASILYLLKLIIQKKPLSKFFYKNLFFILLNIPLAVVAMVAIVQIETMYILEIRNISKYSILSYKISGGGIEIDGNSIKRNDSKTHFF